MTAQASEEFINELPDIDFEGLKLYDIVVWNEVQQQLIRYPFINKPSKEKFVGCSALWRGYIGTYRLTKTQELILEKMNYPSFIIGGIDKESDKCFEKLQGNFWLDIRNRYLGRQGYLVPFIDGKLVAKEQWKKGNDSMELFFMYRGINLFD